jgi:epsilon-lactone hydrolase
LRDYHAPYNYLAPEHPFPTAVEDCLQADGWLIADAKLLPEQIVFTGESAGGNVVDPPSRPRELPKPPLLLRSNQ